MTRNEFLQLAESEQQLFISKLLHAIKNNDTCFSYANAIVDTAEMNHVFDNVKFGNENIYKEMIK